MSERRWLGGAQAPVPDKVLIRLWRLFQADNGLSGTTASLLKGGNVTGDDIAFLLNVTAQYERYRGEQGAGQLWGLLSVCRRLSNRPPTSGRSSGWISGGAIHANPETSKYPTRALEGHSCMCMPV